MPHLASTSDRAAVSGDAGEPPRAARPLFALKDADTFLVADAFGDILGESDGFFRDDTRVLSGLRLILGGQPPSLLSASVSRDNVFFTSHMTNRPLPLLGGKAAPEGIIHLERTRFLAGERLYERLCCVNYGDRAVSFPLALEFAADFRDMFEVRGTARRTRGHLFPPVAADGAILFRYEGLDGVVRETAVTFSTPPVRLAPERADFLLTLPPNGRTELYLEIGPDRQRQPGRARFRAAGARARLAMRARCHRGAVLRSSSRLFNEWLEKSRADLALLTTELPTGPYPYAGIPWFSTPFGRDAIVTALQTLWLDATLAKGVLKFLARHQAQETSSFRDSAPGKIVHETRKGEMTALSELPFGQYYGGVDTTPLFVTLAGAYAERTGDLALIDALWPALEAAMGWIESASRASPDGFLVYERGEESGLSNQGWKDSDGSVFHADGRIPEGPIALIEVQGYVFAALQAMAALASRRGDAIAATRWQIRADSLRAGVEERFWMEDRGTYGIALDGGGALCRVRTSNPGHLLFVGLPGRERALRLRDEFLSAAFDSGWGLRTLATGEPHFNPISYHNGSVWPHDTALCAAGLARYGEREGVVRLLGEMFEAAVHFGMRLPELFCGFPRAPGEPPIAYPVACLPQAWAAGAVFMMLQACLGLRIDGWCGEIHIDRPRLPVGIDRLAIHGLAVGDKRLDLVFQRIGDRVVAFPEARSEGAVPVLVHV
jgi:glycogen debranching enzyme